MTIMIACVDAGSLAADELVALQGRMVVRRVVVLKNVRP